MTALALIAILALLLTGALVMLFMVTRENVRLHSEIARLNKLIAPFDRDRDGRPGGSVRKFG